MRQVGLLVALLVPASLGTGLALAQAPQVVVQATTPAPVPSVMPGVPGSAGPGTMPAQVAPPAITAGPADATPFSAAPSAELPSDNSMVLHRDSAGPTQGSQVPNLSK
jgi:hypothetical protein